MGNVFGLLRPRHGLLTAIVIALGLVGCAEVNHLREAQSAFSEAAQAENAIRTQIVPNVAAASSIGLGYSSVITNLDSLSAKDTSRLKKQGLWGNVLVLKAMAYWRLNKYQRAFETAKEASGLKKDLGTRDRVMAEILPQLIGSDEKLEKLNDESTLKIDKDTEGEYEATFRLAMEKVEIAQSKLAANHPMQRYLTTTHLAIYKNLSDACAKRKPFVPTCRSATMCPAYRSYSDLKKLVATVDISSGRRNAFLQNWRIRAGFNKTDSELNALCKIKP